jgi:hypothetical protein
MDEREKDSGETRKLGTKKPVEVGLQAKKKRNDEGHRSAEKGFGVLLQTDTVV